jgi:hypothetical protein
VVRADCDGPVAYSIVDLPLASVLQAYFLGSLFGAGAVQLAGEAPGAPIRILPPSHLSAIGATDVFVNENSLPEMTESAARGYLLWARSHARLLFSYNQESRAIAEGMPQVVVRDLAESVGDLRAVSREQSWLRAGYVEDVYLPAEAAAGSDAIE